jgi:hypothetical protein
MSKNNKNSNSPQSSVNNKNRLHVLGIDAEVDPCIGRKLERGFMLPIEFIRWLWVFLVVVKHDFSYL